jgi:choline dehydrogenase
MSKPAPVTPSRADYVVVGSGSAGSIVARRLAESGAVVVLLEAGGPDRTQLVRKPGLIAVFHNIPQLKKKLAWEYYTIPQKNAHERTIPQTKGRVLGGSSSINGMLFVRGNRKNYDDWAAEGCKGWAFDDVLPSFKRLETWEDGETELRGGSGPVKVTRQTDLTPASQKFLGALQAVTDLPMLDDYNGPSQEGVGIFQQSAAEGLRYSSSVAYLDDPLPSLYVETGATVTRVVIENGRATGVEYVTEEGRRTVHADAEVVLSAGVFASAQILMLSGVGPADHVRGHGIHVHADLPVGDNLHDHLFVPMTYVTKDAVHRGTTPHFAAGVAREYTRGNSWLARTVFEAAGFVRSSQAGDIPDLQIHALPWSYPFPNQDAPTRHKVDKRPALTIMPTLIYPKSRGSVRLASNDPLQHPIIDPAYLAEQADSDLLLEGIKLIREVMAHSSIKGGVDLELSPGADYFDDAAMAAELPNRATTVYHPVGTCRMGVDERAVVDPELRVRGIDGLRVADTAIMPSITGGNTNAPAMMIGERCAELILRDASFLGSSAQVLDG